jgi:UDP-N-acetylglucosamine 2-epimerase (non-hydrolysing)
MRRILFIVGTRPEAIKLCPVILRLRASPAGFDVRVCVTAQHREMLDQVLGAFHVTPDFDLDLMLPAQTLFQSTSRIIAGLEPVFDSVRPDMVLVQGDTTTTFCGALAAFYKGVPVGHVEAGLRTWDMAQPFPEEMNRVLTSRLASLHFAPTEKSAHNLRNEGIPAASISVTGNTGIDAVLFVRDQLASGALAVSTALHLATSIPSRDREGAVPVGAVPIDPTKKLIVVTAHRRESFGAGFESICRALARIAARADVQLVYPVHPNPNVQDPVSRLLAGKPNVYLIEPLPYVPFVDLMRRAYFLITDSGGIQEEGPSLGKPILVVRDKTERPEAVEAGTVKMVGTDENRIYEEARNLLDDPKSRERLTRVHNPYGDGHASERIEGLIASFLTK